MGSLGLISLLLAVAIIAATCGYIGSAVVRRNKRRARGRYFLLGFFCGSMAGTILRRTRRGTDHFAARALTLVASIVAYAGTSRWEAAHH